MSERTIFLSAMELDSAEERAVFLENACAGDSELRNRINSLLQAHQQAGGVIDELASVGERTSSAPSVENPHGDIDGLTFLGPSQTPGSIGSLGAYDILEVIGRGGAGIVLKARDVKLQRIVAIKVLAPKVTADTLAKTRFSREARSAAAVSHDHIVTIYAVDEANGVPFIVMECIIGCSLQQKIEETGPLELKEILRIGLQTAQGLAAAHKQGIIHRDIKPGNILLQNGIQRVKISDFGLARAAADVGMTDSGQIIGTPLYMSPEQALGEVTNHRSDLFSLGSVLYSMCTGRPAFRANAPMAVLRRVCEAHPTPIRDLNPDIPDWLAEIVSKLMSKRQGDRFDSANEVAELLSQHLKVLQEGTPNLGPRSTIDRPRSSRGWIVLALYSVIGLAVWHFAPVDKSRSRANVTIAPLSPSLSALEKPESPPASASASHPTVSAPTSAIPHSVTIVGGQWSLTNNELIQSDTSRAFPAVLFGDTAWRDYDFSLDAMRTEGNDQFALYFRATDSNNLYWFGSAEWVNTLSQIGTKPEDHVLHKRRLSLTNERWYTARVRVRGEHIEASLSDGSDVVHSVAIDDARHPFGRVGIRTCCSAYRFRNIKVTDPDGRTLWEGLPELPVPAQEVIDIAEQGETEPPVGDEINLLEKVKLPDHVILGKWEKLDHVIRSKESPTARFMSPVVVTGNYKLTCKFIRRTRSEPVCLIFPVGASSCVFQMDSYAGSVSGLGFIDKRDCRELAGTRASMRQSQPHANGVMHEMQVTVSQQGEAASIRVSVDGRRLASWKGQVGQLSTYGDFALPNPRVIGVVAQGIELDVHELKLQLNSGGVAYELGDDWANPLNVVESQPPADIADKCLDWMGKRYFLSDTPLSLPDSQVLAGRIKGRLLTISSAEEESFLVESCKGRALWMAGWCSPARQWRDERNRPLKYFGKWAFLLGRTQPDNFDSIQPQLVINTKDALGWDDIDTGNDGLHACIEWGEEYPNAE